MRGILFAVAVTLMTSSAASASSFVVLGEAKAPEVIRSAGSSIVVLGAAEAPVAITSDQVDPTETASTNAAGVDPRKEDAPRAKPRAAIVAAEWARLSAVDSRSMVFFGTPDPEQFKTADEQTASIDPAGIPMVMRGGIEGGAFSEPAKDEAAAETEASKDAKKPEGQETASEPTAGSDAAPGVKKKPAGDSAQPDATAHAEPAADQPAKTEQ